MQEDINELLVLCQEQQNKIEELEWQNRLQNVVLDHSSDWVFLLEQEGAVIYCNGVAKEHFEINDDSLGHTHLSFFWCGAALDKVAVALDIILATKSSVTVDVSGCGKEPNHYHMKLTYIGVEDSNYDILCVTRNVTNQKVFEQERQRMEDELIKHRDYLEEMVTERTRALTLANQYTEDIIRSLSDTLLVLDLDGTINYLGGATLGYQRNELEGKRADVLLKGKDLLNQVNELEKDWEEFVNQESQAIRQDGSTFPVLVSGSRIRSLERAEEGKVLIIKDVSAKKEAETEWELMRTQMLAASKLASLGEIATGIAHEINQPLTYINSFIYAIHGRSVDGKLDINFLQDGCKKCLHQIKRITKIIDHLRSFGRANETNFKKVQVSTILDNSLLLLGKKLEANNIMVEKNIEDDLPSVFGNENQLEQVFINLFQNATDAFDRNQKDAKITIDIYLHGNCKSLIIDFSDNGMGIKKEIQEKIFEPFFTTKEVGKGTGVGLSIVYGIIREHRGEIICRSNSGLGTLFRMSFPT